MSDKGQHMQEALVPSATPAQQQQGSQQRPQAQKHVETMLSFNIRGDGQASSATSRTINSTTRSGVAEVRNSEGDGDNLLLMVMDPHRQGLGVFLMRFILIGALLTLFTILTFGPVLIPIGKMQLGWYVLIGFGSACIVIAIVSTSRFICKRHKPLVGKGMVKWFSWLAFLDLIHSKLKPGHRGDLRITEFSKKKLNHFEEKLKSERSKSESGGDKYYFDFMADTGDGFDSTYAVFSTLAKSEVTVLGDSTEVGKSKQFTLPRSDAVFVGGDICYPLPRHEMIMSRFIRPLSWALPVEGDPASRPGQENDDELSPITPSDVEKGVVPEAQSVSVPFTSLHPSAPRMFIMPGNHEYFDGLRNFNELILKRDHIGGWRTPANSPYFAVKLPYGWWVFCIDLGSDHYQDMDPAQETYFTNIVRNVASADDRFIIMQHEPDWLKNGAHHFELFERFQKFRKNVLGSRLRISFAGDLHYYRRMEEAATGVTTLLSEPTLNVDENGERPFGLSYNTDKAQLIVAGFGGAFSHPTNNPVVQKVRLGWPFLSGEDQDEYQEVFSYPSPTESRNNLKNRVFKMFDSKHNGVYGHILGAMFFLMFAAVSPLATSSATIPAGGLLPAKWASPAQIASSPGFLLQAFKSAFFYPAFLWILIERIIVAFANIPKTPKFKIAGLTVAFIHSGLQVGFAFLCRWLVDIAWGSMFYYKFPPTSVLDPGPIILYCFLTGISMYILGYFLAVHITAMFFASMSLYIGNGFSYSESFSPLMEKNYKGFVRVQLDSSGNATLYVVGIGKTPDSWRETTPMERSVSSPGVFAPKEGQEIRPFLIEKITVSRDAPGFGRIPAP